MKSPEPLCIFRKLPGSAAKLESFLGRSPEALPRQWDALTDGLTAGTGLSKPAPLFRQIEDEEIAAAKERLPQPAGAGERS